MRYYDVEIVVIENMSAQQKASESWPLQVNLIKKERTVELGQTVSREWLPDGVDLKASYKKLSSAHYNLTDYVKKISASKRQRVIFHTAWRQPGLDKNTSLPVHFIHEVAAPPVIGGETVSEQRTGTEASEIKTTPSILEGVLRVTLARYLHLEAELTFKDKQPEIIATDNPFVVLDTQSEREKIQKQGVIHLKQKRRRMRSKELHYIDHPVLGILINIIPYEKPEEETVTTKK